METINKKREPIVDYNKSSILNKILVIFFVVILLVGISINYFLQKYLNNYLNNSGISSEKVSEVMSAFIKTGTGVTLLFAFISIIISFIVAKSFIKPIVSLKKATDEIGKGNWDYAIKVESDDEIGELAVAFNKMVKEIKEYHSKEIARSKDLELEVAGKSGELQSVLDKIKVDKNDLEMQRMAILNILEDISESKEELENLNKNLAEKSEQLESLKSFSDELTGVIELDDILDVLDKYFLQLCDFSALTYLVYSQDETGKVIYRTRLKVPVGSSFINKVRDEMTNFISNNANLGAASALQGASFSQVQVLGEKIIKNDKTPLLSLYTTPLMIGGKILGAVQLASIEKKKFEGQGEKKIIDALVSTASVSIARMQSLIKYQNLRTESLVESLSDGIIMFNIDRRVILVNPAATRLTGISKDSFDMNHLYRLFEKIELEKSAGIVLEKGNTVIMNEVALSRFTYELYMTPIFGRERKIIAGALIIHDITHLKEVDRMKTEFVSVASHQLRTPLTAIKLFTEMMLRGDVGKLEKDQHEYLENIYQSTERMVRLVNDLLSLSRLESGRLKVEPKPVQLEDLLDSIIGEMVPVANNKGTKIEFKRLKNKMPKVNIDENLFRQVLHNLLTNAVRYSASKDGKVEVKLEKEEQNYLFSVKDNGIGIPEADRPRIFEKFYRADNARIAETEGSGLGLYVSKMVVESAKGKIWFETEENKGTTFFVTLPVTGMEKREGEKGLPDADNKTRFS